MPGFFLTFIFLCFAAGWSRYLSGRVGKSWPMVLPGVAIGVWTLMLVYAAVISFSVTGNGGDLQGDSDKLGQVLTAAEWMRYLSVGTLLAMVPITVVAWARPAAGAPAP